MCDLRNPPTKIKNRKTGEVKNVEFKYSMLGRRFDEELNQQIGYDKLGRGQYMKHFPLFEGVYRCGASGVGYYYYDGKNWHNPYDKEWPLNPDASEEYEFIFDKVNNLHVHGLGRGIAYNSSGEPLASGIGE